MREVAILIKDDLDHSQVADEEVQLALDGAMVRLDLTTGRATALREFLAPYLKAGTPILTMDQEPDRQRGGTPQRKAYLQAFRNWCEERGVELHKQSAGGFTYPKRLLKEFDAALARGEVGPDGRKIPT